MATTTTNFGWDIPQSTDLVKDGATAIATLGQDIDTAMVDLKGGTTGQVLAKASGTDLDFSWVAQDDSNAIQNAIVDAKGDLIAATANDTPARLAVGTDGQILTADSTAATGIKWAAPAASGALTLIGTTTLSSSGSFNLSNIFSSTYDNYLIIGSEIVGSTASFFNFGLRSGSTNATGNYNGGQVGYTYTNSNIGSGASNTSTFSSFDYTTGDTNAGGFYIKLGNPFAAKATQIYFEAAQFVYQMYRSGFHSVATSYDSMYFTLNSGTISGKVSVYGYSK
jgi:hypothetical protein